MVKILVFKLDGDGGEGTDHNRLEAKSIIHVDATRNNMEIVARKKQGEKRTEERCNHTEVRGKTGKETQYMDTVRVWYEKRGVKTLKFESRTIQVNPLPPLELSGVDSLTVPKEIQVTLSLVIYTSCRSYKMLAQL